VLSKWFRFLIVLDFRFGGVPMKKDNEQSRDMSRREFVKGSLAASVGVAVAAAVPASAIAATEQPIEQPVKQKGYHLTNHILDYYKAAAL